LSGPVAAFGAASAASLKAAVDVVNSEGGILGRHVELTIEDDQSNPTQTVSLITQRVTSGTKPDLTFAGLTSSEVTPAVPILAKAGLLSVGAASAGSLDDPAKYPLHFSVSPGSASTGPALVEEMASKGYKKIGVAVTSEEHGLSTEATIVAAAKAKGIATATVEIPTTTVDATPQVSQLKAANPDAVVFVINGAVNGAFLKARTKLGWTVPTYSEVAGTSFNIAAMTTPADWTNVSLMAQTFLVAGNPATETAQFKTFTAAVGKYLPTFTQGIALYVNTYDLIMLVRAAAKKANSDDPQKVATAIETISEASQVPDFVGSGTLFNGKSHFPAFKAADYVYVPVGPTVNGLVTKPTS
jgi:ABC-type branched-subunit amino acid transport system substrate-binding protein